MANPEHLAILRQGVEAWNRWRQQNPEIIPDLADDKISGQRLRLERLKLRGINFSRTMLSGVSLSQSDISHSFFGEAIVRNTTLINADLAECFFGWADLTGSSLGYANLSGAWFLGTTFADTDLFGTNLSHVRHSAPSSIGIDCLIKNIHHVPGRFFIEAGVPETLLDMLKTAIQQPPPTLPTVFISYGFPDQLFVDKLYESFAISSQCSATQIARF